MPRIFVSCDDDVFCVALRDAFQPRDGNFEFCCKLNNTAESIEAGLDFKPDLVIFQKKNPRIADFQVSNALKLNMPRVPLFLVTQLGGMQAEKEALSHGIDAVFIKDRDFGSLVDNVDAACGLSINSNSEAGREGHKMIRHMLRQLSDQPQNPQ